MSRLRDERRAPRAVAFFDVDGTLVPGISSAYFLAERLGHGDQVAEAEAAWDAGLVGARYVEELDARGWAGTSETQVRQWLSDLPLVQGIAEVVHWCRNHDVVPVLATLAWDPVGSYLRTTFGFADSCGTRLETRDGVFAGRALDSYDEYVKRDFAHRVAMRHGLSLDRCAAVGDSKSDLPLFDEVGCAIAFNADPGARARAHAVVDSGDVRDVLPVLSKWLFGPATQARLPGG
ncbi:haloacid dehalogenase-like hydrolase [Streptomyces sp. NPDC050549]|uniref:HAD family hydrolase n=1 Tax=Streptomyces sp. NPDC050549 TaxID=3155406 RepID=UPI00343406FA